MARVECIVTGRGAMSSAQALADVLVSAGAGEIQLYETESGLCVSAEVRVDGLRRVAAMSAHNARGAGREQNAIHSRRWCDERHASYSDVTWGEFRKLVHELGPRAVQREARFWRRETDAEGNEARVEISARTLARRFAKAEANSTEADAGERAVDVLNRA